MRRGAKPAKAKVEATLPGARKSLKDRGSKVRDLEKPGGLVGKDHDPVRQRDRFAHGMRPAPPHSAPPFLFGGQRQLALENLALRQHLAFAMDTAATGFFYSGTPWDKAVCKVLG